MKKIAWKSLINLFNPFRAGTVFLRQNLTYHLHWEIEKNSNDLAIHMNRKELPKTFMMILNWNKTRRRRK